MDSTPTELLLSISSFLHARDLASLARCNRRWHSVALCFLYRTLHLETRVGALAPQQEALLCQFIQKPDLVSLVRHIRLEDLTLSTWCDGSAGLIQRILSMVLDSTAAERIQSFQSSQPYVYKNRVFPRLQSLTCTNVRSVYDAGWVEWHLQNCRRLQSLELAYSPNMKLGVRDKWNQFDSFQTLTHLRLQNATNIHLLTPPAELLELELKNCTGTKAFIQRLAIRPPSNLRALRVVDRDEIQTDLVNLLICLSRVRKLEELVILLGRAVQRFPLEPVMRHACSLQSLVLESRERYQDSKSGIPYKVCDLQSIVQECTSLRHLGFAVDIGDPARSGRRYKRCPILVRTAPLLQSQRLL